MQSKCELIEYKVPRFMYDVDIRNNEKRSRKVSFENTIRISTSDKDITKGAIDIQIKAFDEDEEIKYSIELIGKFKIDEENANDDEKELILKTEGLKDLYSKLKDILEGIQNITKQKLPFPPSVDEINTMD